MAHPGSLLSRAKIENLYHNRLKFDDHNGVFGSKICKSRQPIS
jgi:hypothetical protein